MEFEPKSENVLQNDQKSIMFSVKVIWHSAMSKNLIKPMKNEVSEMSKTRRENPYKTCLKLMNFE